MLILMLFRIIPHTIIFRKYTWCKERKTIA